MTFGQGCPGPNGNPQLSLLTGSEPRLGSTLQMQMSNLPMIATITVGILGLSNSQSSPASGGYPLPADLGAIGLPGCTQYVSVDNTRYFLAFGGSAPWNIGIPFNPIFAGVTFHMQGAVLGAPTDTVTNAATAQIGI